MENTQNYLLILEESLNKKIIFLDELSKLTNLQKDIVSAEEFDDEAFSKNLEQKDAIIKELEKLPKNSVVSVEYNKWLHNHPTGKIQVTLSIDDVKLLDGDVDD